MDYKVKQVLAYIDNQEVMDVSDVAVYDLVKSICELIQEKIDKEEETCTFCVEKKALVYERMNDVMKIFRDFDFPVNVMREQEYQVFYSVYFVEE